MHSSQGSEFYWLYIVRDVYTVLNNGTECSLVGTKFNHQRKLHLFSRTSPLEFVTIDISGPLSATKACNQFVVIMTDMYTKLTIATPTTKIAWSKVANIFSDDRITAYGTPDTMLSENGQQFVSKLFTSLCFYIGTTKLARTALSQQINAQVERNIKTLASPLRPYIKDNLKSWDIFVQPVSYAYSCQVHRFTTEKLFTLDFTRHPPGPTTHDGRTALPQTLIPPQIRYSTTSYTGKIGHSGNNSQ